MREFLFRGKRVDNGDFIISDSIMQVKGKNYCLWGLWDKFDGWVKVKPETVGQFTGLCDKNGRKIFEGDIVESPNGTQGFIEWQNAECAFLVCIGDDWQTMDDCTYEVVGNIYDNKENRKWQ